MIGGCLIAFGFFLTLNFMGVISIQFRDWWPVILIAVGAFIIFKGKHPENVSELEADKSILDITVLMGGNKTVCNAKKFKFGDITAIMGGVELDLRGADIESEAVLDLWASWGGIMIRVPAEWSVVNRGTAIMGAIEDKTSAPAVTTKRLIISGTAIMGGVEIKN